MDFNGSTLLMTTRSPFARRVRLAFHEYGIKFTEKPTEVFQVNPELNAINPLGRVPTLVLKSGEILVDSQLILNRLYESLGDPIRKLSEKSRLLCDFWSAMGLGLCEKTVEYFLESLRPEANRDPDIAAEIQGAVNRTLAMFEAEIGDREFLATPELTQADLDMGTAFAYLSFRYSTKWVSEFPKSAQYFQRLDRRKSFVATRPVL